MALARQVARRKGATEFTPADASDRQPRRHRRGARLGHTQRAARVHGRRAGRLPHAIDEMGGRHIQRWHERQRKPGRKPRAIQAVRHALVGSRIIGRAIALQIDGNLHRARCSVMPCRCASQLDGERARGCRTCGSEHRRQYVQYDREPDEEEPAAMEHRNETSECAEYSAAHSSPNCLRHSAAQGQIPTDRLATRSELALIIGSTIIYTASHNQV